MALRTKKLFSRPVHDRWRVQIPTATRPVHRPLTWSHELTWAQHRNQLLALDPWGDVIWQIPLADRHIVAQDLTRVVLQSWDNIEVWHHQQQRIADISIPPDFVIIGISGDTIWAQRQNDIWGWDLTKGRAIQRSFHQAALTAPLTDHFGQELWLLESDWVVSDASGRTVAQSPHYYNNLLNQRVSVHRLGRQIFIQRDDQSEQLILLDPSAANWESLLHSNADHLIVERYLNLEPSDPEIGRYAPHAALAALRLDHTTFIETLLSNNYNIAEPWHTWLLWAAQGYQWQDHHGRDYDSTRNELNSKPSIRLPLSSDEWSFTQHAIHTEQVGQQWNNFILLRDHELHEAPTSRKNQKYLAVQHSLTEHGLKLQLYQQGQLLWQRVVETVEETYTASKRLFVGPRLW